MKTEKLVCIGGSAGSLAAIRDLFESLSTPSGMSLIVVQHLSPDYKSQLVSLISKWTTLPVSAIHDGVALATDHVYVAAPGQAVRLQNRRLFHHTPANPHLPIDQLAISVADELGPEGALVILSGIGHDGLKAASRIRSAGGLVLAQDPQEAEFASMPESIIKANLATQVLNARRMGPVLQNWAQGITITNRKKTMPEQNSPKALSDILELVRAHSDRDMTGYKPTTVRRRIERRMGLRHVPSLEDYLELLQQNPAELAQLVKDLLIGVTTFFRDEDAFKSLETLVLPNLIQRRSASNPVRVWIAGCSTGEEAYSLAILLIDAFTKADLKPFLQIFATDVEEDALAVARTGLYGEDSVKGLSELRLKTYFNKEAGGSYRIAKSVRESIVFAVHNLISDPPFSKLDLVVCRNLLIYLNTDTQSKLLDLFRFVINPGGYLFLGGSESIGSHAAHFSVISKQWRLFQHNASNDRKPPTLPILSPMGQRRSPVSEEGLSELGALAGQEKLYRQLVESHGPTQVLINAKYELLYVSGAATRYISVPAGQASHDFLKMVNPALAMPLRTAINQAQKMASRSVVSTTITESADFSDISGVRIEVLPIEGQYDNALFWVGFSPEPDHQSEATVPANGGENWVLQQLVQELNATREDLLRTIEQSRVAGEEMMVANEEVMAMNEELQSANEELESSKEELQSLNEELVTSSAQLDAKILEIEALNTDLTNLLNSAETATILLDRSLCVRRFTKACVNLMRIIPGDIGRTFDDVVRLFDDASLSEDIASILQGASAPDKEIQNRSDQWFVRRVLPYCCADGAILGVILTFPDITTVKQNETLLQAHAKALQWQSNLLSKAAAIIGRDLHGKIVFWNQGAQALYGWSEDEALGQQYNQLLQTRLPQPLEKIQSTLLEKGFWQGELTHVARSGEELFIESNWSVYRNEAGAVENLIEVNTDISKRRAVQRALHEREAMFHTMMEWTHNWEYWLGENNKIIYMTPSVERITGYSIDAFENDGDLISALVYLDDLPLWHRHQHVAEQSRSKDVEEVEFRIVRKDNALCWVNHSCRPVYGADGEFLGRRVTVRDITSQKNAEKQIRNLAYFDSLTHLPNRRLFMDRMNQALISSKRNAHYGALLMLDIDHFKALNDTRGHDVGDLLLIETAKRLIRCVRQEDTVARLGGDEFVVLLESLGNNEPAAITQVENIAEKVRAELNRSYCLSDVIAEHYSSCSIGLTLFQGMTSSVDVLMKQADLAMYQAKDAGRNMIRYFNPAMQAEIDARTSMEHALRRGLELNQFTLFYQPQIDTSGALIGAEALIRWINSDGALVPPLKFIPLAEQSDLILQLGQWVLSTACEQLQRWSDHPEFKQLSIAINVSARQFHQTTFVASVMDSLTRTGIDPKRLKLELTESVVLGNIDEAVSKMNELTALGIRFSLDDFGTGYSSLSYLKQLPISQIKIDKSFVQDIVDDASDAAIVRAIIAMSHSLGLQVIAEGVETQEQFSYLKENGCVAFQGYLFGKPVPIEQWQT